MREQTTYIALSVVYLLITLAFIINRLYVRILGRGEMISTHISTNTSDTLVVIAWFFKVAQAICDATLYAQNAMIDPSLLDAHADGNQQRIDCFQKIYYIQTVIYYIPLYCIKGAILCYLLEITPELLRRIRRLIYVGLGLIIIGVIFSESVYIFSCGTTKFWWSTSYHFGVCRLAQITMPCSVFYHVLTDLYIYTIPFLLLSKLRIISFGQRIAAGSMFGAGFLLICLGVGTAAPVRGMFGYWFGLHEQTLAILIACLPQLRVSVIRAVTRRTRLRKGHRSLELRLRRGELTTKEVSMDRAVEKDFCRRESETEGVARPERICYPYLSEKSPAVCTGDVDMV